MTTPDTTPESLLEYTPNTEEILRGFTAPAYKIEPQRDGEPFGEWLGRCSIETMHSQIASEAAARRWLTAHDAEVARKALTDAADEIERIVNDAEVAETVAFPPGTVGLGAAIDRRDRMLESPEGWLRARAEQIGEN